MNQDVFITIVFVGIAVLVALVALVFVVPQILRDERRVSRSAPRKPELTHAAAPSAHANQSETTRT